MLKQTLALIGLTLSISANAALVDAINALNPGDQYRVLFATSTTTSAISTEISTYNTFANNAGAAGLLTGGLGLTWKALASTATVDACANTASCPSSDASVSIFNTQGLLVAGSYSDLWDGTLVAPVGFDDSGIDPATYIWTGTTAYGVGDPGFTLGSTFALVGSVGSSTDTWTRAAYNDKSERKPIYALSDVATVVPIPAAAWLFGSALLGLAVVKRKKS